MKKYLNCNIAKKSQERIISHRHIATHMTISSMIPLYDIVLDIDNYCGVVCTHQKQCMKNAGIPAWDSKL